MKNNKSNNVTESINYKIGSVLLDFENDKVLEFITKVKKDIFNNKAKHVHHKDFLIELLSDKFKTKPKILYYSDTNISWLNYIVFVIIETDETIIDDGIVSQYSNYSGLVPMCLLYNPKHNRFLLNTIYHYLHFYYSATKHYNNEQ